MKHVTERKMEGEIEWTRRQGRIRKQLLDDLEETRIYWKLSKEALDGTVRRTHLGRDSGTHVGQTT